MFQQRFINISFIQRGCLGCLHLQFQLQQNQAFLFFVCLLVGWALTKNALRSNQQLYLQHGEIHIHTLIYLYIFNLSLKLTFLPLTPQGGTPSALSSESTKCKKQNIIALPRSERVPLHWHWEFQRNIRSEYSHERMQSTHGENVKKKNGCWHVSSIHETLSKNWRELWQSEDQKWSNSRAWKEHQCYVPRRERAKMETPIRPAKQSSQGHRAPGLSSDGTRHVGGGCKSHTGVEALLYGVLHCGVGGADNLSLASHGRVVRLQQTRRGELAGSCLFVCLFVHFR